MDQGARYFNNAIGTPQFKAIRIHFTRAYGANCRFAAWLYQEKTEAWLITRYGDVLQALKDDRPIKNKLNALTEDQRRK